MVQTGQRYVSPGGAEMIVTKGGEGSLTDGDVVLKLRGESFEDVSPKPDSPNLELGKRFQSVGGDVVVLVTKAGLCDLRYDDQPMEVQQPRKLPSSD